MPNTYSTSVGIAATQAHCELVVICSPGPPGGQNTHDMSYAPWVQGVEVLQLCRIDV